MYGRQARQMLPLGSLAGAQPAPFQAAAEATRYELLYQAILCTAVCQTTSHEQDPSQVRCLLCVFTPHRPPLPCAP